MKIDGNLKEQDIRTLFNSVPGAFLVLDPELKFVAITDELMKATQTNREEIMGKYVFDVLPDDPKNPSGFKTWKESLLKVLETGEADTMPLVKYSIQQPESGEFVEMYWRPSNHPVLGEDKKVRFIIHKTEEVTKRYQAEKALEQTEKRFQDLANSLPQLAWMTDELGAINWLNNRWYEYTGGSIEASPGRDLLEFCPQDQAEEISAHISQSYKTGLPWEATFPLRNKDGDYKWFLTRAVPIKSANGKIVQWFGTCTDIHEQKMRLMERDEFMSIASHELKTPVTSLMMQIEFSLLSLEEKREKDSVYSEIFSLLKSSLEQVDRITLLIQDLLDLSKIQAGKMSYNFEESDLTTIAQKALDSVAGQVKLSGSKIEKNFEPDLALECDRFRVEQVLVNLITNALKYGLGKEIKIRTYSQGENAFLVVEDHGMGIEKEKQEVIFQRFERAITSKNISGLGLGLYISKQIVTAHNGRIELKSEKGKGSKFTVILPKTLS